MKSYRNFYLWFCWFIFSLGLAMYYYANIQNAHADRTLLLPGDTTHGHYQIEMACDSCHTKAYADTEALQEACESCHADALKAAKDDHPQSKFTDPRNADRLAKLDARYCVTCHVEHKPEHTLDMGLTLPVDYCHLCHEDVAEERPSHEGMAFDTCASAGCHNYHDNRALYEDFLIKHLHEPDMLEKQERAPELGFMDYIPIIPTYPMDQYPPEKLDLDQVDAPEGVAYSDELAHDWFSTRHAEAGVNCTACHMRPDETAETDEPDMVWVEKPDEKGCVACHSEHVNTFYQGKHGMRLDMDKVGIELTPMTPAMARLPMKDDAMDKELGCNSCHAAHKFNIQQATVESCLSCHNDEHSQNYIGSQHHQLLLNEESGEGQSGTGVSCASCHMPREEKEFFDGEFYLNIVNHNQSDTLSPNEKMIRPVCLRCHGLEFSINALADPELAKNNYDSYPGVKIEGMQLAEARKIADDKRKQELRERREREEAEAAAEAAAEEALNKTVPSENDGAVLEE